MFPFKSKKERTLIKKLTHDIEDFCMDENVTSKEQLYKNCGKPIDVVAEYFSTQEMSYIVRKSKINKWNLIKPKSFCTAKEAINRTKDNLLHGQKHLQTI